MASVDYDHDLNRGLHTVEGAAEALRVLFPDDFPCSILDVGCGTGTWLRAALERGAQDVFGLEGVDLPPDKLLVAKDRVRHVDLNQPLALGRTFDLVISFEVAEHLEAGNAEAFVDTLTRHGDRILFSAATPGQAGTHHVNCQWPAYWQALFNARGFACSDAPRWSLWDNPRIEPWYRQNMILATRDPALAGSEARIKAVLHPDILPSYSSGFMPDHVTLIENGGLPWSWYVSAPVKAARAKLSYRRSGASRRRG